MEKVEGHFLPEKKLDLRK